MLFGNDVDGIDDGYEKEDSIDDDSDEVLHIAVVGVQDAHKKPDAKAEEPC